MAVKARSGRQFGFVVPRCGRGIGGGVETLFAQLARNLQIRGDEVEIFTTCARDNRSWENYFPRGTSIEDGLTIHRFPVDPRNLDRWIPLQTRLGEGLSLSVDEQLEWISEGVNSAALYSEIEQRAREFDAIFFGPYLFSTTFYGSLLTSERALLIPCLHDEQYAYLDVVQSMFRQVRGCLFNAAPEADLARSLYGAVQGGEVGMGFERFDHGYIQTLSPYFKSEFPYLLYLGRKETGKNVQVLVDYFVGAKDAGKLPSDVSLVVAGPGSFTDVMRPEALQRPDIIDIEHTSELEKHRLLRHAKALVQPSTNESFSIVIMEAWLMGTPVIVHGRCAVTRAHVVESGGGVYFSDADDFAGVADTLCRDVALRASLAAGGADYVTRKYSWDAVIGRFNDTLSSLRS